MRQDKNIKKSRRGLVIYGTFLVGLGLLLQLWAMDILPGIEDSWPVFIILIGLALIVGNFFKKTDRTDTTGAPNDPGQVR